MFYSDFLNAVLDDGEDEVRRTYLRPDQALKRAGALAGFGACRGQCPDATVELLKAAQAETERARRSEAADYWYWRSRELQIGWTLNVLGAAGFVPVTAPCDVTSRGASKAASILGMT